MADRGRYPESPGGAGRIGGRVEHRLAGSDLAVELIDVALLRQHVVDRAEQEFVRADAHLGLAIYARTAASRLSNSVWEVPITVAAAW